MNKKYILILTILIITVFVTLFIFFSQKENSSQNVKNENQPINFFDKRKTFVNELTGEKILSETEPVFFQNRPIGVMVNNALPARPQIGLKEADLIYEIIAEGGITRFLAFYYSELPEVVGPVRSTREYYLQIVKETGDSMLMHIGYSPQAREKIDTWDIKSLGINGGNFYRNNFGNPAIATEHTAFVDIKDLLKTGEKLGWSKKEKIDQWKFKDSISSSGDLKKADYIEINFWYKGDYSGIFKYNKTSNKYVRYSGFDEKEESKLFQDRITKNTIEVSNLVVMFADEFPIPNDDKNRLDYKLIGEGKALFFMDGAYQEGVWKKNNLETRTKFYLVNGSEVEFNRGKSWVSIVPSRNTDQVIIK